MCSTQKARANKYIWYFALKDRVVNERPQTLAQAMEIACLSQEVFNEQFGALKIEKNKTTVSGKNNKNVNNQPQVVQNNGQNNNNNNQKRKNEDSQQGKKQANLSYLQAQTCR